MSTTNTSEGKGGGASAETVGGVAGAAPGRAARRGLTTEELRRHNLSAVLDRVHLAGPISRSELARLTGLNRSTIRDLLVELESLGLVVEDMGTADGPGRPSAVARPRPSGAVALAVELEVDFTAVAAIGLGGHVFGRRRTANPHGDDGPERIVGLVAELAAELMGSLPPDHNLVGVGGAAAGLVRREDGHLSVSPNRGWRDAPLGELLASALGIGRVRVANEADVGALAELRRGAARSSRHVIYVSGEVGLGLGIITDGEPLMGVSGFAGEAGHTMINPGGRECRCGSVGCWETEVGEEALARRAGVPSGEVRQDVIDELLRRAHAGDPRTFEAFRETGRWLGYGVGNLVNTFNPDLIVFGGFYYPLFPFLSQPILESAAMVALASPWASCRICPSELGLGARLIGAAELVFADVIADPTTVRS
ncbi:MAG: ROK family transcriptional regulator [Actinomycetota bacterium]|nr:ROK family transcriptional regulator [Actinomycetota bacterium]